MHGKRKVFALPVLESSNFNAEEVTFVNNGLISIDQRLNKLSCVVVYQLQVHFSSEGDQHLAKRIHKAHPYKTSVYSEGIGA